MTGILCKLIAFVLVAYTIAAAQESATVRAPDIVRAGETIDLEITLDRAPNFAGSVMVGVSGPGIVGFQSGCDVKPGEKGCHYVFRPAADAQAGTWYVDRLSFWTGTRQIDLPFKKLPFQVIANSGLIFPTSGAVAVNPSQVQLLRREATRLQLQLQALKARVSGQPQSLTAETLTVLRGNVEDELKFLRATESKFQDFGDLKAKAETALVFFDDLRRAYEDVLSDLRQKS